MDPLTTREINHNSLPEANLNLMCHYPIADAPSLPPECSKESMPLHSDYHSKEPSKNVPDKSQQKDLLLAAGSRINRQGRETLPSYFEEVYSKTRIQLKVKAEHIPKQLLS